MPAVAATVALVPFDNLSGDPAQDVLARGFVEDIASALSRFGTVEVLYPKAVAADSPARGAILNALATTMLRGSIRRAGDTIRITAQLLDAQGGRQLWADRFDVTADTLFSVQDEIAERVASALVMGVARTRLEAAQRAPLSTLETYDCWLRGFECLQRGTVEAGHALHWEDPVTCAADLRTFLDGALRLQNVQEWV
jgi:TolB-like protein